MVDSPAPPPPPAEASLIRLARDAAGLSPETASARMAAARIGGGRWRQIESGYRTDRGTHRPVRAKAPVLAHMALAVGVTAERMAETGRDDAAAIMREFTGRDAKRNTGRPTPGIASPRVDERWRMLRGSMEAARDGLTGDEYRELVRRIDEHLRAKPEWQPPGTELPPQGEHPADTG